VGKFLFNLFAERSRVVKFDKPPKLRGIDPLNLLEERFRYVKLNKPPSADGSGPENRLEDRSRMVKPDKLGRAGIGPDK
jgi:hypothetical protein